MRFPRLSRLSIHLQALLIVLCLSQAGCSTYLKHEKLVAERLLTKSYYSGDYTSQDEIGKLRLKLRSPSKDQMLIRSFVVTLDDHEPETIPVNTDIDIELDPGKHTINIYAPTDFMKWMYKGRFGKEMNYEFQINQHQMLILEYTGPYTAFGRGEIKEEW